MTLHDRPITRRAVVAGASVAAAAAAVGCSSGGSEPNKQAAGAPKQVAQTKPAEVLGDGVPNPKGEMIADCKDIPLGSGKITSDGLLVTQPVESKYYAFHGECPHAGCAITQIIKDKITCTCHGSEFSLTGDVEKGPARKPLRPCHVVMANEKIFKQD